MAKNPYGKVPKNESSVAKKSRQKKFYTFQREDAEKSGDKKTATKIYDKLNAAKYGKTAKSMRSRRSMDVEEVKAGKGIAYKEMTPPVMAKGAKMKKAKKNAA